MPEIKVDKSLDEREHVELFAEGMEAAYCDLLVKECPYPKNGKKAAEWRWGYWEAYRNLIRNDRC